MLTLRGYFSAQDLFFIQSDEENIFYIFHGSRKHVPSIFNFSSLCHLSKNTQQLSL